MMLLSATVFALILGTAVSAPRYPSSRHQVGLNPFWQGSSSLTQGFLCDWCVVGVEDAQTEIRANLDQILSVLERVSQVCEYCPVQDQCIAYFQTDIPAAINEFLAETPNTICTDAGLCDANATVQGMVMNNLRGDIARDRVIKRMLSRARVMQQKMIRLILGDDYMCTACQDIVTTARDLLLDNETQHEVVEFLSPLCAYMPAEYQTECTEFVQSIPALMTMVANEVLVDSICSEFGFCNRTKVTPDLSSTMDVINRLGLPGVLSVMGHGQDPFQFPGGINRQNPFRFPGQGQTPYGYPSRPRQDPSQSRPSLGRYPYQSPSLPGRRYPYPSNSRPQQRPGSSRPSRPQKPRDPSVSGDKIKIPDLNLDDIFAKTGGMLDRLPSLPEMPDVRIPESMPKLPISIPGVSRRNGQSYGRKRGQGQRRRGQRSLADWRETDRFLGLPKDTIHEYIPDEIPDAGITITEDGADENCEVCKVAVIAVDTWLEENAPKLQKMISKVVKPFCKAFPSPMKEDCSSDVTEFVQTFIEKLVSKLQPEPVCTWLGVCNAVEEEAYFPTAEPATDAAEVEPATETPRVDFPMPLLKKKFKNMGLII